MFVVPISKAGDADVRRALSEAGVGTDDALQGKDKIKSWGLEIGNALAIARPAIARKLAAFIYAMWSDCTFYVAMGGG